MRPGRITKPVGRWLLIFGILLLLHLPYLLGKMLYCNGDEAIIGIMARDFIHGQTVPFYFYGQHYGFTLFESIFTATSIFFLGSTVIALKVGALFFASVGYFFIYEFLRKQQCLMWMQWTILLVLMLWPGWFILSTRGYILSFVTAMGVSAFLLNQNPNSRALNFTAVLFALGISGQPLVMMPFVIPLMWKVFSSYKLKAISRTILIGFLALLIIRIPVLFERNYWSPGVFSTIHSPLHHISVKQIWSAIWGYFFYGSSFPVPFYLKLITIILAIFSLVFAIVMQKESGRYSRRLFGLMTSSWLVCLLAFLCFAKNPEQRYLLAISTIIIPIGILLMLEVQRFRLAALSIIGILVLLVTTIFVYPNSLPGYWYNSGKGQLKTMEDLMALADSTGIHHWYCTEAGMTWVINYLSDDSISTRYLFMHDRVDRYLNKVEDCQENSDCRTAVVSLGGISRGMITTPDWYQRRIYLDKQYTFYPDPPDSLLRRAGFELRRDTMDNGN